MEVDLSLDFELKLHKGYPPDPHPKRFGCSIPFAWLVSGMTELPQDLVALFVFVALLILAGF